jgi:N6-L-threonylcarbamoyladenine synthase
MKVLGIETSCDECAAAVVEDGSRILSNVVATQIPFHAEYNGVVPEIASRKHTEWISQIVDDALSQAGLDISNIDAVAATAHPGLVGSLLVGLTYAKTLAWARGLPFIACDHMLAHLYAANMCPSPPAYPFLGLLVSGGHTIICRADGFDNITVLGTTRDDAIGEAFDKLAKHYALGYPGGKYIDDLAATGDSAAFALPVSNLTPGYDVSYSGLKTAAINQIEQFRRKGVPGQVDAHDLAASFQRAAVATLLGALFRAAADTGLDTVVSGGGVAANSHLRASLAAHSGLRVIFPPLPLCGDNGAMVAGLGYQYLIRGERSPWDVSANARVVRPRVLYTPPNMRAPHYPLY